MSSLVQILIKRGCITINQDASISDLISLLNKHNFGCAVVLDGANKVSGIISERDIIRNHNKVIEKSIKVLDVMTKDTITCNTKTSSKELMQLMTENKIRHIPIVEQGELLGIVSIGDVVNRLIKNYNEETKYLRTYINS